GDVDRPGITGHEIEQSAQGYQLPRLLVDGCRVLGEDVEALRRRGVLELEDRLRAEQVSGALAAPLVLPSDPQRTVGRLRMIIAVGIGVTGGGIGGDVCDGLAPELVRGRGEVAVDEVRGQADGLERLRTV